MSTASPLLLIGWDGADWQTLRPLLASGQLPHLRRIIESGVSGDLRSFPPYLSPMLWNTIATGHHPAEHGIIGFTEWSPETRSIQPISSRSRRRKALWTILSEQDRTAHVVGWFASHPAEAVSGVCVSEAFGRFTPGSAAAPAGAVYPPELAELMQGARVPPHEVERGLLTWFIPEMTPERLAQDARAQKLLKHLSELYSIHNAAIDIATHQPRGLLAVYFHFIDWICHDFAEYAAPRRPDVAEVDFELYRHVLDRACALQDLLLGELLRALGPDVSVLLVSDHGFLSGDARPTRTPSVTAGIAAWHRPIGILAAHGPLFQSGGGVVSDATLFDIAPSVLHALGLPVGRDLPGRMLAQLVRNPAPVAHIDSWETAPAQRILQSPVLDAADNRALLKQFQDLGYISTGDDPFENAETLTRRENAWNLGHALLQAGRIEEALPCFEQAWFHHPDRPHLALPLARCQASLGLAAEARETLATVRDYLGTNPEVDLSLAELTFELGDHAETFAHARHAAELGASTDVTRPLIGRALLYLERWDEVEALARAWLTEQAGHPIARLLLGRALFRAGRLVEARAEAEALTLARPELALAWFTLGQIALKAGDAATAATAHARAHALRPELISAAVGKQRADNSLRRARGEFVFCEFKELDFRELPRERVAREDAERIATLRAAATARFETLHAERTALRAQVEPVAILYSAARATDTPLAPIVVVSGLPRSGTSLMMQMLVAAGLPAKTDGLRAADEHNPRGFFEWEPVKDLHRHPTRLREAAGCAVKIVSSQTAFIPADLPLRVLWMDRPVEEIARSQEAMIRARHPDPSLPPFAEQLALLTRHREETLQRLESGKCPVLRVDYLSLLRDPARASEAVAAFLGELLPEPARLAAPIEPALHRQKADRP